MKSVTFFISEELESKIYALRAYPEYQRMSKAEILRVLIAAGLEASSGKDDK